MSASRGLASALIVGALSAVFLLGTAVAQTAADRAAWPKDIYPESGNRLPIPKREDMNAEERKIFDDIMARQQGGLSAREKERPSVRMHSPGLSKGLEAAHHVGPQLHACPHLGEFLCPLKQACIPTRVRCAQSGSHPCDAATRNQYLFSHALNCGAETVRSARAGAAISDVQQTGTTIHAERSAGATPRI